MTRMMAQQPGLLLIVRPCPGTITTTTIPSSRKPSCACARWKPCSTEKGYVDPAALDLLIETYEKKVGPAQRRPRGGQGLGRSRLPRAAVQGCHARDRRARLCRPPGRAHRRAGEHAASGTTWSCARCAPVIRGRCSACRRSGTSRRPTARARSPIRAACSRISASALPKDIEIRVWDSTAEIRYLVIPMRPAGTEGWSEDKLAELVTRDSMIGTGLPKDPAK